MRWAATSTSRISVVYYYYYLGWTFVVLFLRKNVDAAVRVSRSHCKLSDSDIVTLMFDRETNSYHPLLDQEQVVVGGGSGRRHLERREHVQKVSSEQAIDLHEDDLTDVIFQVSREYPILDDHHQHLDRSLALLANPPETVLARHCICADEKNYPDHMYFCPLDKNYCVFQRSFEDDVSPEPRCVNETRHRAIAKTVWPVVLVWYALILVFLFFTVHGRNASDYCMSSIFPCWNDIVAQNIMRRNPTRAVIMMRRWHDRYRENVEQLFGRAENRPTERVPTRLELKTTVYSRSDHNRSAILGPKVSLNMSDTDDIVDGHSCAICFAQLEDGDRVGSLPCQHIFHVTPCLKTWLKRRNVCPLCLHTNVATPRF